MIGIILSFLLAGGPAVANTLSPTPAKKTVLFLKKSPENADALKKEVGADYVGKPKNPVRLNISERDFLFSQAGLVDADLTGFDELEKDLLLRRVKYAKWTEVLSRYPKIAPDKLAKLKELAKKDSRF